MISVLILALLLFRSAAAITAATSTTNTTTNSGDERVHGMVGFKTHCYFFLGKIVELILLLSVLSR